MFLVTGITGHVGGAGARALIAAGHPVRALVRDPVKASAWARDGVDLRRGDLGDAESLAAALQGVEAAFLLLPPVLDLEKVRAFIASYRQALRRSPPQRLVVLSSVGSEKPHGVGLIASTHLLEDGLHGLPFPTAFVRAGSFLENYQPGLHLAAESGWFDTFHTPTDRSFPLIASEDIGREIARLLATRWSDHRVIELGSRYSADDLAGAMSAALGRPVRARSIPRERWPAILHAYGMAEGTTGLYEEMHDGFNTGWIDFGAPGTEPVAASITPTQFFAQRARPS